MYDWRATCDFIRFPRGFHSTWWWAKRKTSRRDQMVFKVCDRRQGQQTTNTLLCVCAMSIYQGTSSIQSTPLFTFIASCAFIYLNFIHKFASPFYLSPTLTLPFFWCPSTLPFLAYIILFSGEEFPSDLHYTRSSGCCCCPMEYGQRTYLYLVCEESLSIPCPECVGKGVCWIYSVFSKYRDVRRWGAGGGGEAGLLLLLLISHYDCAVYWPIDSQQRNIRTYGNQPSSEFD